MSAAELFRLNIELECDISAAGLLLPLARVDAPPAPRFVAGLLTEGFASYARHDLPQRVRVQLAALTPDMAVDDPEAVKAILAADEPCERAFLGIGYSFTQVPAPDEYPDATWHDGCSVVMIGGEPVARAWATAENEQTAELAVETLPAFRRRGYGRQVAAAWAAHVMAAGKVAFYSRRRDNTASEWLAESLGVVQYARVATYT